MKASTFVKNVQILLSASTVSLKFRTILTQLLPI
jgi:hypothetical protein